MTTSRHPPAPFDLVVVTGFLGAGKTTLLNRLLPDPRLADTLVVINEFGDVSLDHLLIEKVDGDMLVMTSGCLCCSIRGDLVSTLEDALRRRDNDRITPFRRVVIETTGLADPAPVLHTIMSHPYLRLRFRLQAVVTLVDGLLGAATLDAHPEAVKQAALADRLVLSKTDVADSASVAALRQRLAALNPSAPQLAAADGEADVPALFEGPSYDPSALGSQAADWLAAEAIEQAREHDHHGHDAHDHDRHDHHAHDDRAHTAGTGHAPHRHGSSVRAFCLRDPRPIAPHGLSLFLELLRSAHGSKVLRLKGIVAVGDDPDRPIVVHGVQHVIAPPQRIDAWPDADRDTRLVVIADGLDPKFVEGLWRAAAGDPQVDEADLATRAANPLAPARGGLLA